MKISFKDEDGEDTGGLMAEFIRLLLLHELVEKRKVLTSRTPKDSSFSYWYPSFRDFSDPERIGFHSTHCTFTCTSTT